MKSYALKSEDSKKFIKYFRMHDGQIEATLGNNQIYNMDYSNEKRKTLLVTMKHQVEEAWKNKKFINIVNTKLSHTLAILLTEGCIYMFVKFNTIDVAQWFTPVFIAVTGLTVVLSTINVVKSAIKKADFNKNKYFIEHEDEINQAINIEDCLTIDLSQKMINKAQEVKNFGKQFDINDNDEAALKDLKALVFNLRRLREFGLLEEPEQVVNEGEQFVKKA